MKFLGSSLLVWTFCTTNWWLHNRVKKFWQDGFYNSIGDLNPLTTSSVTSQHYNFSTNQDCHPMYVVPMAGCSGVAKVGHTGAQALPS